MTQNTWHKAELFHGLAHHGSKLKHVLLRELNGYDEQFLAGISKENNPSLVTQLLERVVFMKDHFKSLNKKYVVQNLSIGDRSLLLIYLCTLSFGDDISGVLDCPNCHKAVTLELSIKSLVTQAAAKKSDDDSVLVGNSELHLRRLTGVDQELISGGLDDSILQEKLVRSSVISTGSIQSIILSKDLAELVSTKLSALDPLADIVLNLTCSECGSAFHADFVPEDFLLDKIQSGLKLLEKETHWLALNYHWHEREILQLPMSKRKRYVSLINKTFAGEDL